jgi:hypothetical protein
MGPCLPCAHHSICCLFGRQTAACWAALPDSHELKTSAVLHTLGEHLPPVHTYTRHNTWLADSCRPDWDETVAWLKGMGADIVTTEASLKSDMGEGVGVFDLASILSVFRCDRLGRLWR